MGEGPRPGSIVVLGGGTAGWIAANLLQRHWGGRGTMVAVIESSEIGIIGVGEGSTPQLKAFFDTIGISEQEWMPRCNATYKAGIEFVGWSDRAGFESYFHPFPASSDAQTARKFFYNTQARRTGRDVRAHPDPFFLNTAIAHQSRAPVGAPGASYGYHFDAFLLGSYLREVATARGIDRHDVRIASVEVDANGEVQALVAEDGRRFTADVFVDASGFRSLIAEQALGARHISFAGNLFNDRAVVSPTEAQAAPRACTIASAKSAGWIWHIPLTNRVGSGYVYSSRYIDPDAAAAELRDHLGMDPEAEVRHLAMRVGRLDQSWIGNCLAIGLAQGFLEPLEATAIHIVLQTVGQFIDAVETSGLIDQARTEFNREIGIRYEAIRDYIVCHYRTALRRDTDYWRDAAALSDLSDSLKGLITAWFTGADLEREVAQQRIDFAYSAVSWHCMLAGYGNFPDPSRLRPPGDDVRLIDLDEIERFIAAEASRFPPHREALDQLLEPA